IAARPAEPGEAEHRGERVAERRLREPDLAVDGVRNAERPERSLERRTPTLDARTDDPDALSGRARAQEVEQLLADELERAARTRAFEETHRAVDRLRRGRSVVEEPAFDVRDGGLRGVSPARGKLVDASAREPREVLCRPPKRCERRTPRHVRKRHGDLGPPGERLEQRPLGARQVLESVREDGLAVPRVEVRLEALRRGATQEIAIPAPQP